MQDTFTRGRLTAQLGIRCDQNHDEALAGIDRREPARHGQWLPQWLPAISFPGADPGVTFNNFSPRLGLTYDVTGNGKTLAQANYARYYGQVGTAASRRTINPVAQTVSAIPWIDANGDKFAQAERNRRQREPDRLGWPATGRRPTRPTRSRPTRSIRT